MAQSGGSWSWPFRLTAALGVGGTIVALLSNATLAQIKPDATLGAESSSVKSSVLIKGLSSDKIEGGAKRGGNLFHSFQEFNIDEGKGAYFTNPVGVKNILSRVTGKNRSDILGTLGVLGKADLFLINPKGIIFGPNARLDLNGSFLASTADGIQFKENGLFSATEPQSSTLLSVEPGALFSNALAQHQAAIRNQGTLAVGKGQSLTLHGGSVNSTGSVIAPGGTVQVLGERVGLFDTALIDVSGKTGGGKVLIGGDFQGKGKVPNAARTYIGPDVTIKADALTSGNGGRVIAWADEVTGFDGTISATGGSLSGDGGFVEVSGKKHLIFRGQVDTSAAKGLPGTLLLDPTNITIANGSGDSTRDGPDTFGGNNSKAAGSILSAPLNEIDDTAPTTIYESEIEGLSGNTNVVLQATNNITLNNLADNELTFAAGKGTIALTADADKNGVGNFVMRDTTSDALKTNARDIKISAANLTLSSIDTSSFSSIGDAGDGGAITLTAGGNITAGDILSFSKSEHNDANEGGAIALTAKKGDITTGSIDSSSGISLYSDFYSDSTGNAGDGGAVTLSAGRDITTDSIDSYSSSFDNAGDGGAVTLSAGRDITTDPIGSTSFSYSSSFDNAGDGGAVTLSAGRDITTRIFSYSSSYSSGNAGDGGAVTLSAGRDITADSINSYSSSYSSSSGNAGDGGAVTLSAGRDITTRILSNSGAYSSSYSSSSGNTGDGGAVTLSAGRDITASINSPSSSVSDSYSSGNTGDGGAVTLSAGRDITAYISSNSDSSSYSSSSGNTGDGGTVTLSAGRDITADSINSSSYSYSSGNAGDGGAVTLSAEGDITARNIQSYSSSSGSGDAGNGGMIALTSRSGSIFTNYLASSNTFTSNLDSSRELKRGDISLNAKDDITLSSNPDKFGYTYPVSINASGSGIEGNISLISKTGQILLENGLISSNAFGKGVGGNIQIKAKSVVLRDTDATTTTAGTGNAGSITITASNDVALKNSRLFTSLDPGGAGRGGNIEINAGSMFLTDFSFIDTATFGKGSAGNALLKVDDVVSLDNTSAIFSITAGQGDGGNVNIKAGDAVSLTNRSNISTAVNQEAEGDGGDIDITARSLSFTGGSQLVTSTSSSGKAGQITVNTPKSVIISGVDPNFTAPQPQNVSNGNPPPLDEESNGSIAQAQPLTQFFLNSPKDVNPNVEFSTRIPYVSIAENTSDDGFPERANYYSFEVTAAGTRAIFDIDRPQQGESYLPPPGDLIVATNLRLLDSDGTGLGSNSGASSSLGAGGSRPDSNDPYLRYTFSEPGTYYIEVGSDYTRDYTLQVSLETPNAASSIVNKTLPSGLFANTASIGRGGSIDIDTNLLRIADGAVVDARTIGKGNLTDKPGAFQGGNLTIRTNTFEAKSGGQLRTTSEGTGRAGDITIKDSEKITLTGKDSGLFANTALDSTGRGGNVQLQGNSLTLDNGASISAETASNTGGDITLQLQDLLLLRNSSTISATAGTAQAGGDGGNIKIDTDFIVAIPDENSDITANAYEGKGGNVEITTQGIFGTEFREQPTPQSDITASSELGVSGNVQLNTSDVDPSQGLVALPEEVVDVSGLIAQTCPAGSGPRQSKFIVTGRGGVPPSPGDTLSTDAVQVDLVMLNPEVDKSSPTAVSTSPSRTASTPIVEAQGWVRDAKGNVVLTANAPAVNPHGSWQKTAKC